MVVKKRQVEYWRSRVDPRHLCYWRCVANKGTLIPPDYGSPERLAEMIAQAIARYGRPVVSERQGNGGTIRVLTFHTNKKFDFNLSPWKWRERK